MAIKTVPAKVIYICDKCGLSSENTAAFRMKGRLKIERGATDYQGGIVADGSSVWELCNACIMDAESMANEWMKAN